METVRNYYRILHVQPDAPLEVIKASYRTLMGKLRLHPDLGGSHRDAQLINEAYETLSGPQKRAEYDRALFLSHTKTKLGATHSKDPIVIKTYCFFCMTPYVVQPGSHRIQRCYVCKSPLQTGTHKQRQGRDKRVVERIQQKGAFRYFTFWPDKGHSGEIIDLSPKGMRFISLERIDPDRVIKLQSPLLQAAARVTNCQKSRLIRRPGYIIGVGFIAVHFEKDCGTFLSVKI